MKQRTDKTESGAIKYLSTEDYLVSGETFDLLVDESRGGLLRTHPQPIPSEASRYYDSNAYTSHTDSRRGIIDFLYQIVKNFNLKKKVRLINSINKGKGSLLDVGAGTGDFLIAAKRNGWTVQGIEINELARRKANDKGMPLMDDIGELASESYDVITLWHVLEHLYDLETQAQKLTSHLKPGGILVIAVPNFRSYDAQYYGRYWAAYDVPRHLWHFTKNSMLKLFTPALHLEAIFPMLFDAFYVSLLSEKYKSGTTFSLKAIWVGLKSNWLAKGNKEYSSLIYCFRKPSGPI